MLRAGLKTGRRRPAGPLLPTKLLAPGPRPRAIQRRRLLEHCTAASRVRLTLVAAPAGFEKTTLLGQWASVPGPA